MTQEPRSMPPEPRRSAASGPALLGLILIGLGVLFLIGQVVDVDWGGFTWPFFVIIPGLAMVAFGLSQRDGSGLTVAGSMVAIVGLLLLYQNMTDHWESWAYAWALVAPGGSGVGMALYGARSGNAGMTRGGMWQIVTALGIFAVGFVFFEGLIGISGDRLALPEWVMPAAIIGLGVLVLIRAVTSGRERHDDAQAS